MYYDLKISLRGSYLSLEVPRAEVSCFLDSHNRKVGELLEGSYSLYRGVRETFFKGDCGYSRPVSLEKIECVEIILHTQGELISLEHMENLLEDLIQREYLSQDECINDEVTIFLVKRGEASKLRKAFCRIQG